MSSHKNETDAKGFMVSAALKQQFLKPPEAGQISARRMEQNVSPKPDERRFAERHHLNQDDIFEYKRSGTDPGTVLVFNQEIFDDEKIRIRRGSRRDVNEIVICFQRLGFNIYERNVHTDLTVSGILSELDAVANDKKALAETNCLIVFFLSHGHSNEELHGRDGVFRTSEVWKKFANCEELQHKPKMFIFQACKGDYYTTVSGEQNLIFNNNEDASKIMDMANFSASPMGDDILLVYATIEGNLSFRNPLTGTWFIQELCKNFSSYGRRDDVISMITRAIKCVCANYYNLDEDKSPEIQKQMPVFVSTLSKKFYLNRNKDRNVLLNIQKETQDIHTLVNDIAKHIKVDPGLERSKTFKRSKELKGSN